MKDFRSQRKSHSIALENYVRQHNFPSWYRGFSTIQVDAVNKLLSLLRIDGILRDTERIRILLRTIGLMPLPRRKDIKIAIKMCNYNDIAFLWFIMELCYKSPPGEKYNMNEQLIMSSIAILDSWATMAELDSIMPPKQLPKRKLDLIKKKKMNAEKSITRMNASPESNRGKSLPYFQKLPQRVAKPRPRNFYSSPGFFFRCIQHRYDEQTALILKFKHERRWEMGLETTDKTHSATRIVRDILNGMLASGINGGQCGEESFEEDFQSLGNVALKEISSIAQRLDDDNRVGPTLDVRTLCAHHKAVAATDRMLQKELKIIARNRCLRHFNLSGDNSKTEKRKKQVIQELNEEIDRHSKDLAKLAKEIRIGSALIFFTGERDYQVLHEKDDLFIPKDKIDNRETQRTTPNPRQQSTKKSIDSEDESITSFISEQYFKAPTIKYPTYLFDYQKVFEQFDQPLTGDGGDAKFQKILNPCRDLHEVVNECVKRIWLNEVKKFNEDGNKIMEGKNNATDDDDNDANSKLTDFQRKYFYTENYYDPANKKIITKMLKDGLEYITERDNRYVLAAMPEAYKYPMLMAWMYQRFGKEYPLDDYCNKYFEAEPFLISLEKKLQNMPPYKSKRKFYELVPYNQAERITTEEKANLNGFFKRTDNALLELAHKLWIVYRPYEFSNHLQRSTHFQYLPARASDAQTFRHCRVYN